MKNEKNKFHADFLADDEKRIANPCYTHNEIINRITASGTQIFKD